METKEQVIDELAGYLKKKPKEEICRTLAQMYVDIEIMCDINRFSVEDYHEFVQRTEKHMLSLKNFIKTMSEDTNIH